MAVSHERNEVVGFAQTHGAGVGLRTDLSLLAVDETWRRREVAGRLVEDDPRRLGASRTDLISSDEGMSFYGSLAHGEQVGFRLYPDRSMTRKEV